MENQKTPINQNTTSKNQAGNTTASSSKNTAQFEQEKEAKEAEFEKLFLIILKQKWDELINKNVYVERVEKLKREFAELGEEILKNLELETMISLDYFLDDDGEEVSSDSEGFEFEYDSEGEWLEEETEPNNKGKGKEAEQQEQQAETEAEGSGSTEEKAKEPEEKTNPISKIADLITRTKNSNFQQITEEEARKNIWAKKIANAEKSILENLVGEEESKIIKLSFNLSSKIIGIPLVGLWSDWKNHSYNSELIAEITKSNPAEQLKNEVITGLEIIKREMEIEREADKKQLWKLTELQRETAEKAERDIKELTENTEKQLADKDRETNEQINKLTTQKNNEINEANQKLAEAKKTAGEITEKLAKKQAEVKAELDRKVKAIESKEKVEYEAIKEKYEAELKTAKDQAEQLAIKDKALSDYIRLICQQKTRIEILADKYSIESQEAQLLLIENGTLKIDLNSEKRQRANDIEAKNGEIELLTDSKNREIARITDSKNRKIENLKKDHEEQLRILQIEFDTEKNDNLKKHQELQQQTLKIRDLNKEIINLKAEVNNLTNFRTKNEELTAEIAKLQKDILSQTRKKNWALFGSTVQGFTTELLGEKWGKRANSGIQVISGAALFSNMGEWTYEFWLIGIGMGILFLVPRVYRIAAKALKYKTGIELPGAGLVGKIEKKEGKIKELFLESNLDQAKQKAVNVVVNLNQTKEATAEAAEVEPEEKKPKKLRRNSSKKPRKKKEN